jgi:hypothetical protein
MVYRKNLTGIDIGVFHVKYHYRKNLMGIDIGVFPVKFNPEI